MSEARLLGEGVGVYFFTLSLLFVAGFDTLCCCSLQILSEVERDNVIAVFIEFNLQ